MKKLKIYTKTGDRGQTSLFGGKRVSKSSLRVETYGTIDELNSLLGLIYASVENRMLKKEIQEIQRDLFEIGASLANPQGKNQLPFLPKRVEYLESLIDRMTDQLPELRNFILASGSFSGALFQVARSITRRAERRLVDLDTKESVEKYILQYFNRLSDLFFTCARFVSWKEKKKETIWIKR